MSWLRFAAEVIRDVVGSSEPSARPQPSQPPPADMHEVAGLLNSYRAEVDQNFEAFARMLKAQNQQQLRAMQIQRRWNYALTAALVIVTIVAVAAYLR
jgi:hypothetical protein